MHVEAQVLNAGINNQRIQAVTAVVVAEPGRIRDSLGVLLKSTSGLNPIEMVDKASVAIQLISNRRPVLVFIDCSLPDNQPWHLLEWIKLECPDVRCIVLADNAGQQYFGKRVGADAALLKGFAVSELHTAIRELLTQIHQGESSSLSEKYS
jgi:DNA-binding NarL/FixJ family response regulator